MFLFFSLAVWCAAFIFILSSAYGYLKARNCYDDDLNKEWYNGWDLGWKHGYESGAKIGKNQGYSVGLDKGWARGYEKGKADYQKAWNDGFHQGEKAMIAVLWDDHAGTEPLVDGLTKEADSHV